MEEAKRKHHQKLSGVLKNVHAKLRQDLRESEGDFQQVWDKHLRNKQLLTRYSQAMYKLANEYWTDKTETRIEWCRNTCTDFFFSGGLEKALAKDHRRELYHAKNAAATAGNQPPDASGHQELAVAVSSNSSTEQCDNRALHKSTDHAKHHHDTKEPHKSNHAEPNHVVKEIRKTTNNGNSQHNTKETHQPDKNSPTLMTGMMGMNDQDHNTSMAVDCSHMELNHPRSLALSSSDGQLQNLFGLCSSDWLDFEDRGRTVSCSSINKLQEAGSQVEFTMELPMSPEKLEEQRQLLYAKYPPRLFNHIVAPFEGKIRLLDVGSCYNPFKSFKEFLPVAIDISPADKSVLRCDFLTLELIPPLEVARDTADTIVHRIHERVDRLPQQLFHVVIFSLLLEYFPSPYQRWLCCEKAFELLTLNGLLIIISPDSKHQNKNAPMIRSWKKALEEGLGFKRWVYLKQEHLHCMAFRKVTLERHGINVTSGITPDLLYIPQDFTEPQGAKKAEENNDWTFNRYGSLNDCNDFLIDGCIEELKSNVDEDEEI